MSGIIVIPDFLVHYMYHDYNMEMARIFQAATGYPIIPHSRFHKALLDTIDVLVSVQLPSYFCRNQYREFPLLGDIPSRIKFVYWVDEIHWDNEATRSEMIRYMDRADVLLSPLKSIFGHWYNQFAPKLIFLPWFAHDRFVFDVNRNCDPRCLSFAGAPKEWHPLRYKMQEEGPSKLGDRLRLVTHAHVSKQEKYLFADYARLLHRHFCAFTSACNSTSGITKLFTGETRHTMSELRQKYPDVDWSKPVGHLHLKLFEIPCTGSLLICDGRPAEMEEIGFEPGKNFVLCDETNLFDVVRDCVDYPERYERVRQAGSQFIQERHLKRNRVEDVSQILVANGISPVKLML